MTTPILSLDEWESGQAQPQVTVNEALRWLECFAQLSVLDIATTPGSSPDSDGECYIVASGATGAFAGHDGQIALYMGTAWAFRTAPPGSIAWVQDEAAHRQYRPDNSPPSWELL
jgi:hypothetical protein